MRRGYRSNFIRRSRFLELFMHTEVFAHGEKYTGHHSARQQDIEGRDIGLARFRRTLGRAGEPSCPAMRHRAQNRVIGADKTVFGPLYKGDVSRGVRGQRSSAQTITRGKRLVVRYR